MKTAVTGGSGVVGRAVVRHLVAAGHMVRALARSDSSREVLEGIGASVVPGDLLDESSVRKLVTGSDWVFHVAGVNELCVKDPAQMWKINVEGTLTVLEASIRAGAHRLIHTSSAVALGEPEGEIGSEGSNHRGHFLSEYERSKHESERLVMEQARDIEVVSVNPSSVQGPGRSTGSAVLLIEAAKGRSPVLFDTVVSLVDIDDCARGHLLAAERGETGRRYVLSGHITSVREVVGLINALLGRKWSPWYVSERAVLALATFGAGLARTLGKEFPVCRESARVLLHGHRYDGSLATRELGLEYTPLEVTLQRTLDWFRSEQLA